ncbi:MAG: hypothetical protein ACT443_16260 [Gemmatimonadota bacterium]
MAERHEFKCETCGKEFDDRQQLETHNREQHIQQAGSRQGTTRQAKGESGRRGSTRRDLD